MCYFPEFPEEKDKAYEKLLSDIQESVSPFQELLWVLTFGYYNPWEKVRSGRKKDSLFF